MTQTFRKTRRGAPAGFFATEAAGLGWLSVPGGPRVVQVRAVGSDFLDLERIQSTRATPKAARAFGAALARMHTSGDPGPWGALPPGVTHGFFGPLDDPLPLVSGTLASGPLEPGPKASDSPVPGPSPHTPSPAAPAPSRGFAAWHTFYGEARLRAIMEQGRERRTFTRRDESAMAAVIRRLPQLIGEAGTDRPARLHGDLWSGNVMWTRVPSRDTGTVEAVLIDPAAHAGHREADLAMLALFGAPHLGEMLRGYQDVHPLTPDWQDRIPLHQLYPVAVHAVLFGGGYIDQTRALMAILLG